MDAIRYQNFLWVGLEKEHDNRVRHGKYFLTNRKTDDTPNLNSGRNDFAPLVRGVPQNVEIGESIKLQSLYRVKDLDPGSKVTRIQVFDGGLDRLSGFASFKGKKLAAGVWHDFAAQQLKDLEYNGGLVEGNETLTFRVYDGKHWSLQPGEALATTIKFNERPPKVTTFDATITSHEVLTDIGDLIEVKDPEGQEIKKIAFRDTGSNSKGGYFTFKGKKIKSGKWFQVNPEGLDKIRYHAVKGKNRTSEKIQVKARDFKSWSKTESFTINTIGNRNAPKVKVRNVEVGTNSTINPLSGLFTVSDDDGNTMKRYRFFSSGDLSDGTHFTFKGRKQRDNKWFEVKGDKIEEVVLHSSQTKDFERVRVQAFDGRYWSDVETVTVRTNPVPTVSMPGTLMVESRERVRVYDILSSNRNGGAEVAKYQIYDSNNDRLSARFEFDGKLKKPKIIHTVDARDLKKLFIEGGSNTAPGHNQFFFRPITEQGKKGQWTRLKVNTDDINARALNSGNRLFRDFGVGAGKTITYSFMGTQLPSYYPVDASDRALTLTDFADETRRTIKEAFDQIGSMIGLTFREVRPHRGIMQIGHANLTDLGAAGYARYPNFQGERDVPDLSVFSDIMIDNTMTDFSKGSWGYLTIIHEIGHALGLKHSFDGADGSGKVLPGASENHRYTMMSYNANTDAPNPASPLIYDLLALQHYYGPERKINRKDTTYIFEQNEAAPQVIWDPSGIDTLSYKTSFLPGRIDLRQGYFSSVNGVRDNLKIGYGSVIENVIGGRGNEEMWGNEVDNILDGREGRDRLYGEGGNDTLKGGKGNDTYLFRQGDGFDVIDETGSGGIDELIITGFDGFNKLKDLKFSRVGKDLKIDLNIDGKGGQGSIQITNQGKGTSRVESLTLLNKNNVQIGKTIDLTSVYAQATSAKKEFKLSQFETQFGFIANAVS